MINNFAARGGYLKPYEGDERVAAVGEIVDQDLAAMSSTA
jgi:hypothetical protein